MTKSIFSVSNDDNKPRKNNFIPEQPSSSIASDNNVEVFNQVFLHILRLVILKYKMFVGLKFSDNFW